MAATNLVIAAKFSVGHKTMVVANPTTKRTRGFDSYFTAPIRSTHPKFSLLRRDSVHKRLNMRIMAANTEVTSSPNLMGVQFFTVCQFQNLSDQNLMLEDCMYWHGYGDTPEAISKNQSTIEFKHFGDIIGSVGAVSYLVGDNVRWVIAWSNSGEDQLKLNKVYSEISEATERGVEWGLIREALDQSVSKYKATHDGYSADLMIDPTATTPTMTATLSP